MPEVNVRLLGFTVDALWRDQRVVVELDSLAAHEETNRVEADRHRELALRAAGFTVLRYTWHQVTRRPGLVVADLRAALA
jgi:very-short-patch-repair endonuclease